MMYKDKKIAAIVPAAGMGRRMGTEKKKQYLTLGTRPILHWSAVGMMTPLIDAIWVVVPKEDLVDIQKLMIEWAEEIFYKGMIYVVEGAADRQGSVYNALVNIPEDYEYVCVHDGVRPFVKLLDLALHLDLLAVCEGFTFGVPVVDSLKKVEEDHVVASLDRSKVWAIQTPQFFKRESLFNAHIQARLDGYYGTDDASLLERMDGDVRIVMGDYKNIKVTTPDDLLFGSLIAKQVTEGIK